MKIIRKAMAVLLAVLLFCSAGMAAFAAEGDDDVLYSITWVYENETIVDQYHEGDTIEAREATLSDGSIGGWSTNPDAEKAPALSPVPKTMPAQDLTFYAKKSFISDLPDQIMDGLKKKFLSKEFWQHQLPILWVFPYVWYHIYYFFYDLFH